jgi:RHS repeat-associated protein
MELVADIDRERSLDAIRCAYLASNSVAENIAKNRISVVRAFLNARYFNAVQGQFLSEDPVFVGNPSQQNLQDPQSLNSYSYANNNPIVKKDPSGRCLEDACVGEIALADLAIAYGPAILGGLGGAINTYVDYRQEANVNSNTPAPGVAQYATGVVFGGASGYLAEERLIAAGAFGAAGSAVQDVQNGQMPNAGKALVSAVTPGIGKLGFGALAGPSPVQELEAGVSALSPVSVLNVGNVTAQQLRYIAAGGVFGLGIDRAQSPMFSGHASYQSSYSGSGGSPGGGGGSSSALVGLYQSLVSTLSSLVSALSSGKH